MKILFLKEKKNYKDEKKEHSKKNSKIDTYI
jgi:hypothetical protein